MFRRLILGLLTLACLVPAANGSARELYEFMRRVSSETWQDRVIRSMTLADKEYLYGDFTQVGPVLQAQIDTFLKPPRILDSTSSIPSPPAVPGNQAPEAADPVVSSVSEFNTLSRDLVLGGELLLELVRFHAAFLGQAASFWGFHPTTGSPMGWNWTHNHHMLLMRLSDTYVAVYYQQGKVVFFQKSGGLWEMAPPPVGFVYMGTPYQMVVAGSKLEMMDPLSSQILTFEFSSLTNGQVTGVEQVRDRNGNAHTYTYNAGGNVRKVVDGEGRSLTFTYTGFGGARRVTSVTDHTGRVVTFNYNSNGTQKNATDANGHTTAYTWNSSGRMLTLTRPNGNVAVTNTYNGSGQCRSQTDGEGNQWTFTAGANKTTITDPLGNQRVHQFDSQLRLTGWVDEAGNKITRTYDNKHRLRTSMDRLGNTSSVTYHQASGQVASVTDEAGHTWRYFYGAQSQDGFTFHPLQRVEHPDGSKDRMTRDATGNVLSWTDRGGEVTSCTYDSAGRRTSCTNASGGTHTWTYDALGNPASITDPNGDTTGVTCDALSRLTRLDHPDGTHHAYTYDAVGNLLSAADAQGDTLACTYDDNDRLANVTLPLGQAVAIARDGNDDVISVTDPLGATTAWDRDGLRNVIQRTAPGGQKTTYLYDARRRNTRITDANGSDWSAWYDDEGRVVGRAYPLGDQALVGRDPTGTVTQLHPPHHEPWTFDRNEDGLVTRMVTPMDQELSVGRDREGDARRFFFGNPALTTRVERNALDQPRRIVDPRGNAWSSAFNDAGQRIAATDPLDRTTSFTYDDVGRRDVLTLPGGMGTLLHTYDEHGHLVRVEGSDGTDVQCQYDANGNFQSGDGISLVRDDNGRITDCNGIAMTWNANGQMTSMELAPGSVIDYAYTPRGQVERIQDWNGQVTVFQYDDAGHWTGLNRPNGEDLRRTVDFFGNPMSIQEGSLGAILVDRDGGGRPTRVDSNGPMPPFVPPFGVDEFHFNAANEISTFLYDPASRLVSDGTTTNQWDLLGRLVSRTDPGGTTQHGYDAIGNITSITEGANTIDLWWNYGTQKPAVVKETENDVDTTLFVLTPRGLPVYQVLPDGSYEYFHWNQNGDLWFTTDINGDVTQTFNYTPEGERIGSTRDTAPRYTWRAQDGVVQSKGRYFNGGVPYDPFTARSLNQSGRPSGLVPQTALSGSGSAGGFQGFHVKGRNGRDIIRGPARSDTGSASDDTIRPTGGPWEGFPLPSASTSTQAYSGPTQGLLSNWGSKPASSPAKSDFFEEFRPLANSYMEFTKGATLPGDLSQLFFPRHTPSVLTVTPADPDCASDDRN